MHNKKTSIFPLLKASTASLLIVLAIVLFSASIFAQDMDKMKKDKMGGMKMDKAQMMKMMKMLKDMAPAKGYIKAHETVEEPLELLGGPISVSIEQSGGKVYVGLPDKRKLDPRVFGNPKMPMKFAGTPGITGVPLMARDVENGKYTEMNMLSPFGDKHMTMMNGNLKINAMDVTATDGAKTKDMVKMDATWQDKDGNTYEVKCCEMLAAHGMEFPTFGGVVTNHILHGFTGIGTPLMPSEFTYFAFWGMGAVLKNGKVLDKPRMIHGMLTEYVRKEGYKLAFDDEITPTAQQFHLMVAPFKPVMAEDTFAKSPVKTGLKLPNGMELPFWHVMFESLKVNSERK